MRQILGFKRERGNSQYAPVRCYVLYFEWLTGRTGPALYRAAGSWPSGRPRRWSGLTSQNETMACASFDTRISGQIWSRTQKVNSPDKKMPLFSGLPPGKQGHGYITT